MTVTDLFETSLVVGLVALLFLLIGGAFRLRLRHLKSRTLRKNIGAFLRYVAVRLPLAVGIGAAFFVLGAAALTLNNHRPPGDNNPVITMPQRSGKGIVSLNVERCDGPVHGRVSLSGKQLGNPKPARFYSDQDGPVRLSTQQSSVRGTQSAHFKLSDPLARRGLLSCFLQLPVLHGAKDGYEVRIRTGSDMEIDAMSSVPVATGYDRGEWVWSCPAGKTCPALATVNYAVESGTKQVIVLVLAAVFGALIALLAGEVLISWTRRQFDKPDSQ